MAQKITLVDDLDGSEESVSSFAFSVEGKKYTMDLSEKNRTAFKELVRPFVEKATRDIEKPSAPRRGVQQAFPEYDPTTVREWAAKNDFEVAPQGRISAEVLTAYFAAK